MNKFNLSEMVTDAKLKFSTYTNIFTSSTILRLRKCEIICTCFFTKLNFHTCVPPLIRLLEKFFTKLNFHTCVPPLIRLLKKKFYKIKFSYLCTPIDI